MAYHVGCNPESNIIYAGTVNKKGDKWTNKSEVTEEVLAAARDHLLAIAIKENTKELGYHWDNENGTMVILKVVLMEKEEADEFKSKLAEGE